MHAGMARSRKTEASRYVRAHVIYALEYCVLCALTCFLLITFDNWAATGFGLRLWSEPFYNARVGLYAGLAIGGAFAVAFGLEKTVFARAPWAVAALLSMAVTPLALDTASQLAAGEGLSAMNIPRSTAQTAVLYVLYAFVVFVWWFSRPNWSRAPHAVIGVAVLSVLIYVEQRMLRTYGMLAPFLLVGIAVCTTSLLANLLAVSAFTFGLVTRMGGAFLLAIAAVGWAMPGWVAAGRRSVLADETAVLNVDPLVFAGETRAVRFDVSHPERFRCEEPPIVAAWPQLPIPAEKRRNVILVSVDALRQDRLGMKRGNRALMPNLARFAAGARLARHAYTSYPATLFALGSAMTGLMPSELLFAPRPPDTLFRRAANVIPARTAVVPASEWFVLPAFASYVAQDVTRHVRKDAGDETDDAIELLAAARREQRRQLLWIHYLEPHAPYHVHEGFDFGQAAADRYDSEVAAFDRELGRLLRALREQGYFEDSLIMLFADHGQALGERGYFGHHVFLHRFISDIPFVMHVPGAPPGTIEQPVSIADVAPTVLHFLDVPPSHVMSGQSLLGDPPPADRGVLSEAFPMRGQQLFEFAAQPLESVSQLAERIARIQQGDRRYHPKVALVQDGRRLIVRRTTGTTELYALEDTAEAREQSETHPREVRAMVGELARWHRAASERFYCAIKAARAQHAGGQAAQKSEGRPPEGAPVVTR
jgi:choline-sulfatase